MIQIADIKKNLKFLGIDGWLFTDFKNRDSLTLEILDLKIGKASPWRWFYFVPREGKALKITRKADQNFLKILSGNEIFYSGYSDMAIVLEKVFKGAQIVATQYSPLSHLQAVSTVDSGVVDLFRSLGKKIISSADLIQMMRASLNQKGIDSHLRASKKVQETLDLTISFIRQNLNGGKIVTERSVQNFILKQFRQRGLTSEKHKPIVAVNNHAVIPHYEIHGEGAKIEEGDRLLIDLWAKERKGDAIYYDITWCFSIGGKPSKEYERLFGVAIKARDAGKKLVFERIKSSQEVRGFEIDKAVRAVLRKNKLEKYFIHTTGHSIDTAVHGRGVGLDSMGNMDDRRFLPGSCFSIEPGIYIEPYGIRTEINLYVDLNGNIHSSGSEQTQILVI